MIIKVKNKDTLEFDDFKFKCSIGKRGFATKKIEGDFKTPKGKFKIDYLYFRDDKNVNIKTKLKKISIKKNMGWCNDVKNPQNYNKPIKLPYKLRHEKMFRNDSKYDLVIPIKYNFLKPVTGKGSAIFIHLTKNYKPTAGCIPLKKEDFLILLKLITKDTKIKIG